jgi:DNA-binding LacI/PurR family transcriptional regulator
VRKVRRNDPKRPVTLKTVAQYVGLAPGTVSAVLTEGPGSRKIPQRTKDRIVQAAAKLNYYPNPFARALRTNPKAIPNISSSVDRGPGTLIFVGAEHCARAIQAIRNAGLSVPGDVAIVSVQNFSAELDRLAS